MSIPVSTLARSAVPADRPRVLVVDDEPDIREPMAQFLTARGFDVDTAADGQAMQARLAGAHFDLVLLDVVMPGEDGFSLCQQMQDRQGPPVILLTGLGSIAQRVRGLEMGADDYLVKPFDPSELLARMRTVLRRAVRAVRPAVQRAAARLRFGEWVFDPLQAELLHGDGRAVSLTAAESRLLQVFLSQPQQVLSRDQLLDLCAQASTTETPAMNDVFDRSIDSQVSRLRRKVEADPRRPRLLKTAWGNGYMFSAPVVMC